MDKHENINIAAYIRTANKEIKQEDSYVEMQRKILTQHVKKHFKKAKLSVYTDNGYSGRNFNRPAFKKMIKDVNAKKIDLIICKDLTRIGRNYYEVLKLFVDELKIDLITLDGGINTLINKLQLPIWYALEEDFREKFRSLRKYKRV